MTERGRLERGLWIGLGTTFVAIGAIGVVVPLLPTTPFLLLGAFCYARGSKRLHRWLLEHRYLGIYLRAYERGEGVSRGAIAFSLLFLWGAMIMTVFFFSGNLLVTLIVIAVGAGVTIHIISLKKPVAS